MSAATFVYFIAPIGGGRIKIGCSASPVKRLGELAAWSPTPLEILATAPGSLRDEAQIHNLVKESWSHKEWFNPSAEIWRIISDIKQLGHLPDYAIATGPVRNFRGPIKKPSNVRTPEWRAAHGEMIRRGWELRRKRLAAESARPS